MDSGTLVEGYFAPGKAAVLSVGKQIDARSAAGGLVLNVLASDRRAHVASLGLTNRKGVEGASLPAVDEYLEVALGIRRQRLEAAIDRALERNAIGNERLEVDLAPAQKLDRRDVVVHRMG